MTVYRHVRAWFSLFSMFFFLGCAGLLTQAEPPQVSLAGIQVIDVNLFEQRYRLRLRLQNPNDFPLPIEGMRYKLYFNEREFAHGVSRQSITLPEYDSRLLEVEVISDLGRALDQIRDLGASTPEKLSYRLTGTVSVANRMSQLPFEYKGEVRFPGSRDDSSP